MVLIGIRIAREGRPLLLIAALSVCAIGGASFFAQWTTGISIAAFLSVMFAGVLWFFRDPERDTAADPNAVLSPADGKVIVAESSGDGQQRVSIFLSLFNVHVNRIPFSGTVTAVRRVDGVYHHAAGSRAPAQNAHVDVEISTKYGPVRWRQISGMLARRVSCRLKIGDLVRRGDRFGLIYFGSRVDVQLPPTARLCVSPGAIVRGGQTSIAFFDTTGDAIG